MSEKDYEALKSFSFELSCPQMTLTRNWDGGVFSGSGGIRQRQDGGLEFTFYSNQPHLSDPMDDYFRIESGQLLERTDLYTFCATDLKGRTWHSQGVDPSISVGPGGLIASGQLAKIEESVARATRGSESLDISLFGDFKVPFNASVEKTTKIGQEAARVEYSYSVTEFIACGMRFRISQEAGALRLRADASANLSASVDQRIIESLEFVFGRPVRPNLTVVHRVDSVTVKIAAERRSSTRVTPYPPFHSDPIDSTGSFWVIFQRYLDWVVAAGTGEVMPPISRIVRYLVQMNDAPIEAQGFALGVAVEDLLDTEFGVLGMPTSEVTQEVSRAMKMLDSLGLEKRLLERMKGSLSGLKRARAKDRLLELVEQGTLRQHRFSCGSPFEIQPLTLFCASSIKSLWIAASLSVPCYTN